MAKAELAIQATLAREGGFVNNPHDLGGPTAFGISLNFYRKKIKTDATIDDIKALTINQAADIYQKFFWDTQPYHEITSQNIASRVFDLSVNTGYAHANAFLQKAVNSLKPSTHLVIDGQLGPKSIDAINSCDEHLLYNALIIEATRYYYDIAKHGDNHIFLAGWLNRLNC